MSLTQMIESDAYQNYRGPELTKAQIWKKREEKVDITEEMRSLYGENNNWNLMLYNYGDVFPDKDSSYQYYVEFHSDNGRKHWFHGMIGEKNQIFNPPLACPINQII